MTTDVLAGTQGDLVIRPAGANDLAACARIVNDYVDATAWLPRIHSREAVAAMFGPNLLNDRTLLVAELDGAVAGYLSMSAEGFVHALYLSPDARGRGIGARLLDRAKTVRPQGLELTVFEPNRNAIRFYLRHGFREVPEGRKDDTEEGVPTLLMRWRGDT